MATILVVEDDMALCDLLRTHLEADGHTVVQAFDGPAALSAVEQYQPHLLLLDWMLPGLSPRATKASHADHHADRSHRGSRSDSRAGGWGGRLYQQAI